MTFIRRPLLFFTGLSGHVIVIENFKIKSFKILTLPVACKARLTFTEPVHRAAGGLVVTETLVDTAGAKPARGTALRTVRSSPASSAATLA